MTATVIDIHWALFRRRFIEQTAARYATMADEEIEREVAIEEETVRRAMGRLK